MEKFTELQNKNWAVSPNLENVFMKNLIWCAQAFWLSCVLWLTSVKWTVCLGQHVIKT